MTHNIDGEDTHRDAFDDAMEDAPSYFGGQVVTDAYTCVLITGQGKMPYNPDHHQGLRTSTAITFNIAPLDPTRKMITREMLNWVSEFKGVVRPSLEALSDKVADIRGKIDGQFNVLREVSELFVIGEFVPKPDNKEGETWTTLNFQDVFATEAECKAAYAELTGNESEVDTPANAERQSLAAFLPGLVTQAGGDVTELAKLLAANETLAEHFTVGSPEVQGAIHEYVPF